MPAIGQLEDGMTTIEVVPNYRAGRLELGQHTIDSRQTDILARLHQRLVDVLGAHVSTVGRIQHLQDLDPRQRYLETCFT